MEQIKRIVKDGKITEPIYDAKTNSWQLNTRNITLDDTCDAYVTDPKTGQLVYKELGPRDENVRQW
jgi:hypothetical protein